MYTVIGFGGVGCRVAKGFSAYSQYNVICIDDQDSECKDQIIVPKQDQPEEYEESFGALPRRIKTKIKDDVIVVVSGTSLITSAILKMLYQIRKKNILSRRHYLI